MGAQSARSALAASQRPDVPDVRCGGNARNMRMSEGYRHGREVITKRLLYVNRRAPHGTIYGLEGLEVVLVGAAFDQRVSLLFLDDGVFQLVRDQDPSALGMKNFAKGFRALEMYDVTDVFVSADALAARGLTVDELIIEVVALDADTIAHLMDEQDVIFSF